MSDWIDNLLGISSEQRSHGVGDKQQAGAACVLISVIQTQGSCPRDVGARMLVSSDTSYGTIGGGHLEYQAIDIAHQLLLPAAPDNRIERFPLGARVGQCCGGIVYLSFEYIASIRPDWVMALARLRNKGQAAIMVTWLQANNIVDSGYGCESDISNSIGNSSRNYSENTGVKNSRLIVTEDACLGVLSDRTQHQKALARAKELLHSSAQEQVVQDGALIYEKLVNPALQIAIFGAGHVGQALVSVLSGLSCRINWFDSREDQFPEHLPDNVRATAVDHIEHEVDELGAGTYVVVMTHSHAIDQAICERMLQRDDLAWCGLIGSVTKRRQFEKRLVASDVSRASLARLICPIGVDGIHGKQPNEIAISVAAQILLVSQSHQDAISPGQSTAFA